MIPLLTLLPLAEKLFDKFIPDPEAKAKAILELKREENQQSLQEIGLELQAMKMQTDINLEEAKSTSLFVSGARPFVIWVCGFALAYHAILQPLLAFTIANLGYTLSLPVFDLSMLNTILMGLLGLGSMRTVEKIRGVASK